MKPKKSIKSYIYERDKRKCRLCSKYLKYQQASLDHYLPRAREEQEMCSTSYYAAKMQ